MSNFDFDALMKQAQAMQSEMMQIQDQLAETIYTGNNGGSTGVTVKINGNNEAQEVIIPEEMMNPEDREMLQDMIMIAFNDALDKANEDRERRLGKFTQGAGLPNF